MRLRLAHPRRDEILDHIRTLGPARDRDETAWLVSRHEFPRDYTQGTGIAFLRDYGIPNHLGAPGPHRRVRAPRCQEVRRHPARRRGGLGRGLRLRARPCDAAPAEPHHARYRIPNDEFQFVLATTIVGPVEWIRAYGWRDLDPVELQAPVVHDEMVVKRPKSQPSRHGLPSRPEGAA
ncbi:MAG: hypothetical protein WB797_10145 [Nocardioides sp.]